MSQLYLHQPHCVTQHAIIPAKSKSIAVADLLWFSLGALGIHKFYLKQNTLGVVYLLSALISFETAGTLISIFFLIPLAIALVIDFFLIPGMVALVNSRGAGELYAE